MKTITIFLVLINLIFVITFILQEEWLFASFNIIGLIFLYRPLVHFLNEPKDENDENDDFKLGY